VIAGNEFFVIGNGLQGDSFYIVSAGSYHYAVSALVEEIGTAGAEACCQEAIGG